MKRILAVTVSLMLIVALGAMTLAASQDAPKPKPAGAKKSGGSKAGGVHQFTGTVTSASATELSVKKGDKTETFAMNDTTKKTGDVKEGAKVTVKYKTVDGKKMATNVMAKADTDKPAAKKGKSKKPAM